MQAHRWSDLSDRQRTVVLAAGVVQVALAVTAWTDLAVRPASQVNGAKAPWAALIAVNFIGPLCYLRWGRRQSGASMPIHPTTTTSEGDLP
jgi:hypothetical protein